MKTLIILLTIAFTFSCTMNKPPAAEQTNSSTPANAAAPAAPTERSATPAAAPANKEPALESIYTDIAAKKCKTTDSNEEEGWIIQICDGIEGYKLEVYEDDIRQSMNVVPPAGEKVELDFQSKVGPGFSSFGDKAEWRVRKEGGKPVPVAIIVRFNVNDKTRPKDQSKATSYLVVTKITAAETCITDVIKPSEKQNEEARAAADSAATKPCVANQEWR